MQRYHKIEKITTPYKIKRLIYILKMRKSVQQYRRQNTQYAFTLFVFHLWCKQSVSTCYIPLYGAEFDKLHI